MSENLKLWSSVEKTDPKHTKKANVRGNNITAIAPHYQVKKATEQFGPYGTAWGFKVFDFDYSMLEITGIVVFKGVFYYPNGEFPVSSSISAYKDGARTKPDADFAKKVETDTLTKALSKLGFNADVFMGMYDDNKYVMQMKEEFKESPHSDEDICKLQDHIEKSGFTSQQICESYKVKSLNELSDFKAVANQVSEWAKG